MVDLFINCVYLFTELPLICALQGTSADQSRHEHAHEDGPGNGSNIFQKYTIVVDQEKESTLEIQNIIELFIFSFTACGLLAD